MQGGLGAGGVGQEGRAAAIPWGQVRPAGAKGTKGVGRVFAPPVGPTLARLGKRPLGMFDSA